MHSTQRVASLVILWCPHETHAHVHTWACTQRQRDLHNMEIYMERDSVIGSLTIDGLILACLFQDPRPLTTIPFAPGKHWHSVTGAVKAKRKLLIDIYFSYLCNLTTRRFQWNNLLNRLPLVNCWTWCKLFIQLVSLDFFTHPFLSPTSACVTTK